MAAWIWFVTAVLLVFGAEARVISVLDFGASSSAAPVDNTHAINKALAAARSGDTVLVPALEKLHCSGGISGPNLVNVTFLIEGELSAAFENWPLDGAIGNKQNRVPFIGFDGCTGLTIAGGGQVFGNGKRWWDLFILGKIQPPGSKRPKLIAVSESQDVLVTNLTLYNSPSFHLLLADVAKVEVSFITIEVDRRHQRKLKQQLATKRRAALVAESAVDNDLSADAIKLAMLEPEDLNTDGIDPSGRDIWIHDCVINNDDDSIAVKPCDQNCRLSKCSENMLIENMSLTGFGASIGSVPPHPAVNCVRNITFRNVDMPFTGKGVYIKSNPLCSGNVSGIIEDILFEDIRIRNPRWWPIWIGPQQQHEPGQALGQKCALSYPIVPTCPTQDCVSFTNITLRRVTVHNPWLSPGVILGNASIPMKNVTFDTVVVNRLSKFPFKDGNYRCENVDQINVVNSTPVPVCSVVQIDTV